MVKMERVKKKENTNEIPTMQRKITITHFLWLFPEMSVTCGKRQQQVSVTRINILDPEKPSDLSTCFQTMSCLPLLDPFHEKKDM